MSIPYSAIRGDHVSDAMAAAPALLLATIQGGMLLDVNGDANDLIQAALEDAPADQALAGTLLVASQMLINLFEACSTRELLIEFLQQQAVAAAAQR